MSHSRHICGQHSSGRVWIGGREILPERSQRICNHSPGGFAWGYGGSGPAQLALAVLLHFVDERTALSRYQDFKWDFVAKLPQADFVSIVPDEWIAPREEVPYAS